jgi:hypothetical protein
MWRGIMYEEAVHNWRSSFPLFPYLFSEAEASHNTYAASLISSARENIASHCYLQQENTLRLTIFEAGLPVPSSSAAYSLIGSVASDGISTDVVVATVPQVLQDTAALLQLG